MKRRCPTLGEPGQEKEGQAEEGVGGCSEGWLQQVAVEVVLVEALAALLRHHDVLQNLTVVPSEREGGVPARVPVLLGEFLRHEGLDGVEEEEELSGDGGEVGGCVLERLLPHAHGQAAVGELLLE